MTSGDWRPTILAGVLGVAYLAILATPPAQCFELAPLDPRLVVFLAATTFEWAVILRWTWRSRVLERVLDDSVR